MNLERQTFKTISRDSGLSIDKLQRTFYAFLDQSPTVKILTRNDVHLRIDATYFHQFCMVSYQDQNDGYTQLILITSSRSNKCLFEIQLQNKKHTVSDISCPLPDYYFPAVLI